MNLFQYLETGNSLPDTGDPKQANCVISLAFGRNDIEDQDLYRLGFMADGLGDSTMVEIIRKKHFRPGLPNIILAERVQDLMLKYNIPSLLQWEIAVALDWSFYKKHKDQIFIIWPLKERKRGFNSKQVLEKAIEIMNERNFNIPILLAHELHIKRVVALWEAMVEEEPIIIDSFVDVFDEDSVQDWTKDKKNWLKKEFLVRIHHLIFGWV